MFPNILWEYIRPKFYTNTLAQASDSPCFDLTARGAKMTNAPQKYFQKPGNYCRCVDIYFNVGIYVKMFIYHVLKRAAVPKSIFRGEKGPTPE